MNKRRKVETTTSECEPDFVSIEFAFAFFFFFQSNVLDECEKNSKTFHNSVLKQQNSTEFLHKPPSMSQLRKCQAVLWMWFRSSALLLPSLLCVITIWKRSTCHTWRLWHFYKIMRALRWRPSPTPCPLTNLAGRGRRRRREGSSGSRRQRGNNPPPPLSSPHATLPVVHL